MLANSPARQEAVRPPRRVYRARSGGGPRDARPDQERRWAAVMSVEDRQPLAEGGLRRQSPRDSTASPLTSDEATTSSCARENVENGIAYPPQFNAELSDNQGREIALRAGQGREDSFRQCRSRTSYILPLPPSTSLFPNRQNDERLFQLWVSNHFLMLTKKTFSSGLRYGQAATEAAWLAGISSKPVGKPETSRRAWYSHQQAFDLIRPSGLFRQRRELFWGPTGDGFRQCMPQTSYILPLLPYTSLFPNRQNNERFFQLWVSNHFADQKKEHSVLIRPSGLFRHSVPIRPSGLHS